MFRIVRIWASLITLFKVTCGEKMLVYVRVSVFFFYFFFLLCGHLISHKFFLEYLFKK